MKHLVILIASLFVSNSCSKDTAITDSSGYYGKWTLVKMSGTIANSETSGAAMEWQEYYLFNTDGTFTKSRDQNGIKKTASGVYTATNRTDGIYFELIYPKYSDLIGSCYGNLEEELYLTANNMLSSTWKNCDGPGLEYKKTN